MAAFDIVAHYQALLKSNPDMAMPICSIKSLASAIEQSSARTVSELFNLLQSESHKLQEASTNPISLSCGSSLLLRFLTLQRPSPTQSFEGFKQDLVAKLDEFVKASGGCRVVIARRMAEFIPNGATILVHGYSRVVTQTLLYAAHSQRKRLKVYVTESRPYALGVKTHRLLTASPAGESSKATPIQCEVILDSAVAYVMARVDMCIVGAEAVCESGGLVNFVGGFQMALAAKAFGKPLFALAESYKFTRLFPLSQFDLPLSGSHAPLSFSRLAQGASRPGTAQATPTKAKLAADATLEMTQEMIDANPLVDYTEPGCVHLIITDLGAMTPSAVADSLLGIFGGE